MPQDNTEEKLSDEEVDQIVEQDEISDEDFDRLVQWVLEEKDRVRAASSKTIWADPYLHKDQDTDP